MASTAATRVNLTGATLEPSQDNASALEVVTAMDDTGVVKFLPNMILHADGSRLSGMPMDRLLLLLLDVCDNVVQGEGTNEEFGLVATLLPANEGGGDATFQDLRKRRTIFGRAFKILVASSTTAGAPKSGMKRATLGDSTYLLLPSRLQMIQPAVGTPTHPSATTTYTLPTVVTPPPSTSVLGKHGRGSNTISETDDKGDGGGAAHSHASGLRTDFDIPKQVT